MWTLVLALAAALSESPDSSVSRALPAATSVDRIAHAARLWGEVRYYHPWIYTRDLDWDAAFIRALPRIESEADERAGLQALLDELHDPVTRMIVDPTATGDPKSPPPPSSSTWKWESEPGGVLSVRLQRLAGIPAMKAEVARLAPEIARARGVTIDLRGQPEMREGVEDVGDEIESLLGAVATRGLVPPGEWVVTHSGYRPQLGQSSGGYTSGLFEILPSEIPEGPSGNSTRRIAIVADTSSPLPRILLAMQRSGALELVAEGPFDDRSVVSYQDLELAEGLRARIRTGELDASVEPDVRAERDRGTAAAREWVRRRKSPAARASASARRSPGVWRPDKTYPEMLAPNRAYRLLALARFWNVIDLFYPYKRLLDRPWEAVLRDFIPRFEQAEGADAYARAVLEMAAQIQDSHIWVEGKAVTPITGEIAFGLGTQWIDGLPVVVAVPDPEAAGRDVRVGDVIEEIDGEPLLARVARLEKYAAGSRPLGRRGRALFLATAGADGSTATLKLRGDDGVRTVQLKRGKYPPLTKPSFRLLADNVGYVDLTRLTPGEVDAMFEKLGSTRALVFDMRGYPHGTAWPIAPRINTKEATHAALFERPFLSGDLGWESGRYQFQQEIPAPVKPARSVYRGRVVMLINEFAISQAEHTGLFFEAATNVTYVGSPTAGANGDVTTLTLPGGISVAFTGHDVRHADGRQLQRIGLEPQVAIRPTLAGIRAGRDEVLERALALLAER